MKKLLLGILIGLGFVAGTAYAVSVFNSNQVGSSPSAGKVLQTNGTTSTWVATTTLGIVGGGGGTWGSITGTLSSQTDLQTALNAKLSTTTASTTYVPLTRNINTTSPLQGGGALSGDLTLSILQASSTASGYLSSTDWSTFNGKQSALTLPLAVAQGGTGTTTPGLIQGANITITGTWPFQTITGSAGGSYNVVSANGLISVATSTTLATLTASTSPTFTNLYLNNALAVAQGGTGLTSGYNNTNWDTAYSGRLQWDGGSTNLVAATGRTSLGLGDSATLASSTWAKVANNLSDLVSTSTAWTNLGGGAIGKLAVPSSGIVTSNGTTLSSDTDNSANWNTAYGWGNYASAIGSTIQGYNSNLAAIAGGTWTGASSITTLGTVTTGTWHGSIIPMAYGGTGTSTVPTVQGQILSYDGSNYRPTNLVAGANVTLTTSTPGSITIASSGGGGGSGVPSTTPFTSGYIPYATSTLALTNSNIFQLGSNVGIGTTSPTTKLYLQNAAGSTAIFAMASSTNAIMTQFDSNGHLQIGTTTDTSNLAIQGSSGQTTNLFNISSSSGASLLTVASAADTKFCTMASSTAGSLNYYLCISKVGISTSSTPPTLSSCGTSPSVVGSNPAMVVTVC